MSPEPQVAAPRPAHSELYFSDDSFGYDDYSDDGKLMFLDIILLMKFYVIL